MRGKIAGTKEKHAIDAKIHNESAVSVPEGKTVGHHIIYVV